LIDVNTTGAAADPLADSEPFTVNVAPLANFTYTPGLIVNVAPDATNTEPESTYGLPAVVHVVLEEIVPDTFVANAADGPLTASTSPTSVATATACRQPTQTTPRTRSIEDPLAVPCPNGSQTTASSHEPAAAASPQCGNPAPTTAVTGPWCSQSRDGPPTREPSFTAVASPSTTGRAAGPPDRTQGAVTTMTRQIARYMAMNGPTTHTED
jgi:hypothetical protein